MRVRYGLIDGASFLAWVEQFLAPALPVRQHHGDGQNLSSHKDPAIWRAIRSADAKLFYLASYSPDLNPIERHFQVEDAVLQRKCPESPGDRTLDRRAADQVDTNRMLQLCQRRRICVNAKLLCVNAPCQRTGYCAVAHDGVCWPERGMAPPHRPATSRVARDGGAGPVSLGGAASPAFDTCHSLGCSTVAALRLP